MPTKRTRTTRSGYRISNRAVELYAECAPLWPGRLACIRSPKMCVHDDCQRYNELSSELDRELGIKPWMPNVFMVPDSDPANPDDYERHFPVVREIRDELRARAAGGNTE